MTILAPLAFSLTEEFAPARVGAPTGGRPPDSLAVARGSWVGREDEMAEALALLQSCRLVTLTGSPGVGKSRLAHHLAISAPQLVWSVNLASVIDPTGVPALVAATLGVPEVPDRYPTDALVGHVRGYVALLVLDNCEHLVGAVSELAEALLDRCGGLRVLVASREPLRIPAETIWRVPPLSLPTPGEPSLPEAFVDSEAVRLFCERAAAVQRGFVPTAGNVGAIVEICRCLDGLPFAIELAARQVEALPPPDIAAHLRSGFELLTDASGAGLPRHQSLNASLQWSYDLLEASDQALLRRLSVFAGGFTLEDLRVEAPGQARRAGDVVGRLSSLVSKSLVMAETTTVRARYRLLETIRVFAFDRLVEADERQDLAVALEWSMATGQAETALRLAGTHAVVCAREGAYVEARDCLERALSLTDPTTPALRACASVEAGLLAHDLGDLTGSRQRLDEALHLARERQDKTTEGRALHHLGRVHHSEGDDQTAVTRQLEALDLQTEIGDSAGLADTVEALARLALSSRHLAQSARLFGAAQSLREAHDAGRLASHQAAHDAELELARHRLGSEPFEAGWWLGMASPAEVVADYVAKRRRLSGQVVQGLDSLTPAERRVAAQVALGLTNTEVARLLFVSVRTVESHLRRIFIKLGIHSRQELLPDPDEPGAPAPEEGHDV